MIEQLIATLNEDDYETFNLLLRNKMRKVLLNKISLKVENNEFDYCEVEED